jgi:hypothetical protein
MSEQRKYSVTELDDLRCVMEMKYLFGTYNSPANCSSRSYKESEKIKAVEEMTRTAMLAGHTADDYRNSERLPDAESQS